MDFKIHVIKGDGIGPEIVDEAIKVLERIGEKFSHTFHFSYSLMGGVAIDKTGEPLPEETVQACLCSDSVLLGAVGGEKWENYSGEKRPEAGLLKLRQRMGLYANLRPAQLFESLKDACPLRDVITQKGIDLVVVRELTSGIYFGQRGRKGDVAYDTESYSINEVRRIAKVAFETARQRRKQVISIDKANVLESSRLWREVVHEVSKDFPDVVVKDMLVDNAAMQLVKDPSQFDVILANNIFGDILSDEAAMVTGSIGMLPSASLGDTSCGLYEPIHGSAPDIAGQDIANPIATILSCAMLLRYSFQLEEEAQMIECAVESVLKDGIRTKDIESADCKKVVGTKEMGETIVERIERF